MVTPASPVLCGRAVLITVGTALETTRVPRPYALRKAADCADNHGTEAFN